MEVDNTYRAYATCPDELTPFLEEEIRSIGGAEVRSAYRVVYFSCGRKTLYRMHRQLRLASRIGIILKEVPAQKPEILFDKVRRIRFHEWFSADEPLRIQVRTGGRELHMETHLAGSKIREALNDSFLHFTGVLPSQSSSDAVLGINGFMENRRLLLSIETSGESLHRRGYRLEGHPAPLKESLADLVLTFAGYDGSQVFYDPMCGSGTLVVEAALTAAHCEAQRLRGAEAFGLSRLKDFDPDLWEDVIREAGQKEVTAAEAVYGSDIEPEWVELTRRSSEKAGVGDIVRVKEIDFFHTEKPAETGILAMNIPYGDRLEDKSGLPEFMKRVGDHLKKEYSGWTCALLTPADVPSGHLGLRVKKQLRFVNGKIPVRLLVFNIY